MLKDSAGMIYKEMNDTAELDFYTLVHESKEGGKHPDAFLRYLYSRHMIPHCKLQGWVTEIPEAECVFPKGHPKAGQKFPPNESGYFKCVEGVQTDPNDRLKPPKEGLHPVLIMENLIKGMENPASCDFKLGSQFCGSYPGEPGFPEVDKLRKNDEIFKGDGAVDDEKLNSVLATWKTWKEGEGERNGVRTPLKECTNADVGLSTPFTFKELKPLMKSLRQYQNNQSSPVKQLKFRCCGMRCRPKKGAPPLTFEHEPYKSAGEIEMKKPHDMSPEEVRKSVEDFCCGDSDLAQFFVHELNELNLWLSCNTHYRFYASSVCLFYDVEDHSKRQVRWLDFAHAHRIMTIDTDGGLHDDDRLTSEGGEIARSVRDAVGNLIDLLAPVWWRDVKFERETFEFH
jgi:hypothetical protein